MRRFLPPALVVGLALAASSPAGADAFSMRIAGSESFELKYGVGYAVFKDRGSVLGRVRRGYIKVANLPGTGRPRGTVTGCETRSGTLAGTLTCRGTDLAFRIYGATWRVRIGGRGINVSGVIRGSLGLDRAESGTGVYSIGGSPEKRWPATLTFFRVRA
jgi:hypothetical protein